MIKKLSLSKVSTTKLHPLTVASVVFLLAGCASSSLPESISAPDCKVLSKMVKEFDDRQRNDSFLKISDPNNFYLQNVDTKWSNLNIAILKPLEKADLESSSLQRYLLNALEKDDGDSLLKAAEQRC